MNKKVIIIVILVAILLICGGVVLTILPKEEQNPSSENKNNKEGSLPAEIVETRNYQQVTQMPANTINQIAATDAGYIQLSNSIGFQTATCEEVIEGTEKFIGCRAKNIAYKDQSHEDMVSTAYLNGTEGIVVTMLLNFYEPHYTTDKVMDMTNKVLGNYFGMSFTKEQIEDNITGIKNNKDNLVYAKEYKSGEYTVELSTQYQSNEKLYIVIVQVAPHNRFKSILTEAYHD